MKSLLTLLALLALLAMAVVANPTIGEAAPGFTLKDLAGKQHKLADYRGKLTVVAFLSAKCPISNAYNERIRALAADYAQRDVTFLALNASADETVNEIKTHADKQGFAFPILKDKDNRVADAYGAVRTPEMFVVDGAGVLRYHGRIDNSHLMIHVKTHDLRNALDELLAGKAVSVAETKALGCIIKRAQQAHHFSAPTGRGMTAQGVSLWGYGEAIRQALKGRNNDAGITPLQGLRTMTRVSQGYASLHPGLYSVAPLGQRDSREISDDLIVSLDGAIYPEVAVVPQRKPAAKRPAGRPAAKAPTKPLPKIGLIKPANFPALRDSWKGQVVVLNLWATWCAPCVAEMPEFVKLHNEYKDKGVKIVAISADDVTDANTLVARFVRDKGLPFEIGVMDTDDPQLMIDQINKEWPGTLPSTFVYDRTGKLIYSRFKIIDRAELVNAVEGALK
ncbi:MAG: redoxin domain-containing protein [Acidobacteria bacterium]|nr:redoxin domain-containing protein [Acidobacteriota bacterium]